MGSKSVLRLGAHGAMLAMLFAQFAVVAYACPVQSQGVPAAMPHVANYAGAGESPCAAAGTPESPQANACEVHCNDGVTLPTQPHLPPVAWAVLPVAAIGLAQLAHSADVTRTPYAALPGAPPPTLRYCRLLI